MNTFNKHIIIEALALDCSESLFDVEFANPATIAYNSAGTSIQVISTYSNIFTHS